MLRDRFGVSERWACQLVGQHRSTQRHQPDPVDADAGCGRCCASSPPSGRGGATAARMSASASSATQVNRKRVQRLWREEGLRVPARRRKRRRLGESTVPGRPVARRAARSRVGLGLPVRSDRRRPRAQAAQRRRRVHPRSARDARRPKHRRRPDRRRPRPARRPARRARARALRQRPGADRARPHETGVASRRTETAFIEP